MPALHFNQFQQEAESNSYLSNEEKFTNVIFVNVWVGAKEQARNQVMSDEFTNMWA